MIILPFQVIKKAQYFGLSLDSFFTLTIQLDEKKSDVGAQISARFPKRAIAR